MKKKIRNLAAMLAMVAAILSSGTMTAYAYVDETEQTAPEPVITEEKPEETEATPFSVAGNGQLYWSSLFATLCSINTYL